MKTNSNPHHKKNKPVVKIQTRQQLMEGFKLALSKSEARLRATTQWTKHIGETSYDVMWDWEVGSDYAYISDSVLEVLGYTVKDNKVKLSVFKNCMLAGERKLCGISLLKTLAGSKMTWKTSFAFKYRTGEFGAFTARANIVRDKSGTAVRLIGAIQDISKQKDLEDRLAYEIRTKDAEINQATEDAKVTERSDIGKELHDNVNQLLGVSKLYLELAKEGGKETKEFLSRSSEYTLSAIEEIRKLTKGLTSDVIQHLGLCAAIRKIASEIMDVQPLTVSCVTNSFIEASINDKFKLNIFRIVQEQLNNIIKYARASKVSIHLAQNTKQITLAVNDDGVGFDMELVRNGIGIHNIHKRAVLYHGNATFTSEPGKGCKLMLNFPIP